MKRTLFAALLSIVPLTASAADAGIGVGVSSFSAQIQADYDLDRRIGLQLGVGEVLFMDDLSLSAGGRFYFVPRKVSPYVGVLYRTFETRYRDASGHEHAGFHESLIGPTFGVRGRKWRGIGAWGQLELMQHVGDRHRDDHHHGDDDRHWHTGLAVGVQWWF